MARDIAYKLQLSSTDIYTSTHLEINIDPGYELLSMLRHDERRHLFIACAQANGLLTDDVVEDLIGVDPYDFYNLNQTLHRLLVKPYIRN